MKNKPLNTYYHLFVGLLLVVATLAVFWQVFDTDFVDNLDLQVNRGVSACSSNLRLYEEWK